MLPGYGSRHPYVWPAAIPDGGFSKAESLGGRRGCDWPLTTARHPVTRLKGRAKSPPFSLQKICLAAGQQSGVTQSCPSGSSREARTVFQHTFSARRGAGCCCVFSLLYAADER